MRRFSLSVFLLILSLVTLFSACNTIDEKHGLVDMRNGRPKPPKLISRVILGSLPTGPFPSHELKGILIMDSGGDFDTDTAFTYLTYLSSRYVKKSGASDIPFHYFIDVNGKTYTGKQDITPAELHEGDPFLYRSGELSRQELLMARLSRNSQPKINLDGYVVICLLGDYDKQMVTKEQEKSLFQLCSYIAFEKIISMDNIKGLNDLYPEYGNPGFYLRNYLQPQVLAKNIPEPPQKHRFMLMPRELE
jgi:hypothetical protein